MINFKFWIAVSALAIVSHTASTSLAQYGLYGSPDVLRLPTPTGHNVGQPPYSQSLATVSSQQPDVSPASYRSVPNNVNDGQYAKNTVTPSIEPIRPIPAKPIPPRPVPLAQPGQGPQGKSLVEHMLTESERQKSATKVQDDSGYIDDESCDSCDPCSEPCCETTCCPWYASAAALFMTRDQPNRLWTTYETNNLPNQLMNTEIEMKWEAGGEIRFGRWFCCNTWALEVGYWTLNPFEGTSSMSVDGGTVSTPLDVADINFAGVAAMGIFDSAAEHKLWRSDEIHNVEINVVQKLTNLYGYSNPFDVNLFVGARYFRFEERLIFGSLDDGNTWGEDGGIHEAYLNDHVQNNLLGVQIGVTSKCCLWQSLSLMVTPRIGIFNNNVQHHFSVYRGDGTIGTCTAGTGSYPVHSTKNTFSALAEVDLGINWQVTQCWGAMIGYRLLAVSGIALSDNQIPHYVVDIPEIANTNTNADLILHGAYVGITYNF